MNQGPGSKLPPRPPTAARQDIDEREGEDELTAAQLAELKGRLDERRATLVASIEGRQNEERDGTGREVGDEMDEATLEGALGMSSKLLERDVHILREIDRALVKLREGTYGVCEGTGEPIGYERLRHAPWARYSIAYQEELEREARTRGQ